MSRDPRCRTCRFCLHGEPAVPAVGWCFRFPPQSYNNGAASCAPAVTLDKTWCGEYQAQHGVERQVARKRNLG